MSGRRLARALGTAGVLGLLVLAAGCTERPDTHHRPGTNHDTVSGPAGTLLPAKGKSRHERLRQVPAKDAPAVTVTVRADTHDGWNIRLDVQRFRFSPDSVGGAAVLGSGHARLLLDGAEVARVYGDRHHLPSADVPAGSQMLTVRLHADDHTVWALDGEPVQDSVPLSGTAPPSLGPDQEQKPAGRTLDITVAGGVVSPEPGRIEIGKGERLTLRVTSDTDDELHVHGVDRSAVLTAGRTATLEVLMDRSGLYEVETHRSGLVLTQLAVR
ncbi:hypothetical protein [Streptomyces sp. C10-9-1]|uniref:hypothetical protein n=1 Tax=Streptomyces sp. C10-9-1 TaxID=1859285 RepID=UPI003D70D11A